ncbi:protein transport protein Sec24c [Thamnocephalis sphaerospora]|uniref:Protein transport protein Sec24c n=1 Tax=Thamnocephalis sphaerospora TaxID=78915 RepID=A0A4P9XFQ9_9FUNG|nr:protein transport protein Sec24c [Thamnocephalis sphaerospora]|eukprot:RKP04414.1 protein transport protein Sec24c [Thamnocephalis sphaerospora]
MAQMLCLVSSITGGDTFFYPSFTAPKDGHRFQEDLKRLLQREFGYEGVMRIRCSDGLRVLEHYGNFFMRNTTDIELAGIDSEKAIAVQLRHDSQLDDKVEAVFQCALLYTRADGQRRIRVHNLSIPVTTVMGNVFRHADLDTSVNYLLKAAMVEALTHPLKNVRDQLTEKCVQVLASYRRNCATSTSPGQLILPESFKLFPLITVAMLKTMALRPCQAFSMDARIYTMRLLRSMPVYDSVAYLYPHLYSIHDMDRTAGEPDANGHIKLPELVRVSYERLAPFGVYLLENSQVMALWIGYQTPAEIVKQLFGVDSIDAIDSTLAALPEIDSPLSHRLRAIAGALQSRHGRHLALRIVRQQLDPSEAEFASLLTEDKNNENMSYVDYLCYIHKQIQTEVSGR